MSRTFKIQQGYKYRVYPNKANREYFHQCFGCARKMYNLRVEQIDDEQQTYHQYKQRNGSPTGFKYEWVTEKQAKQAYPYLKEADSLALVNARRDFEAAFKRYTQGKTKQPRYRSKMTYPRTFRTSNLSTSSGDTIYIRKNPYSRTGYSLHLPKIGKHGGNVPIVVHRHVDGRILNVTVEYTAAHAWYVAICYETIIETDDSQNTDNIIDTLLALDNEMLLKRVFGGDLGLETYVYGTDGISYDDPALADYKKLEAKLHREQRKLGKKRARLAKEERKLCDARNYQKQRVKVARVYEKIRRKRNDFLHKLSRQFVNSHDVLAFEDLCVKGMLKNHYLARGISDAAWGTFIRYCTYKAEHAGKTLVQINRWYPSTRTCSVCGEKTGPRGAKDLGVREWVCPVCGAHHVRDGNAAWNILLDGLRVLSETEDARWDDVLSRVRGAYEKMIFIGSNRCDAGDSLDQSSVSCGEEVGIYIQNRDTSVFSVADEPAAPKKMVLPVTNNAECYSSRQTA